MGLVLYDAPASSNALKVRFCRAELGCAYERREVPLARPCPAEYLAVNPLGLIPTLDDDGFVVAESHTILRYLALREGRDDLYPAAARDPVPGAELGAHPALAGLRESLLAHPAWTAADPVA